MTQVKVLKAHLGLEGKVHQAGETVEMDINRQRALARNGIVPPPAEDAADAEAAAAPGPKPALTGDRRSRRVPLVGSSVDAHKPQAKPVKSGKGRTQAKRKGRK